MVLHTDGGNSRLLPLPLPTRVEGIYIYVRDGISNLGLSCIVGYIGRQLSGTNGNQNTGDLSLVILTQWPREPIHQSVTQFATGFWLVHATALTSVAKHPSTPRSLLVIRF